MEDPVDGLIAEVARRRSPDVPLYKTVAEVLGEAADTLDLATHGALLAVGFEAVKREGEPVQILVPDVMALIADGGEELDPDKVSRQSLSRLAILGLCALAGEELLEADTWN